MISTPTKADGPQIIDITSRIDIFTQQEVDSVDEAWREFMEYGSPPDGYHFLVYRDGEKVLGFTCYGIFDDAVGSNFSTITDRTILQYAVGTNAHIIAKGYPAFHHNIHIQLDIVPMLQGTPQVKTGRVADCDASKHEAVGQLLLVISLQSY